MLKFKAEIESGSSAFANGNGGAEVARILRRLADRIESTNDGGATLYDVNGNNCGWWALADDEEEA